MLSVYLLGFSTIGFSKSSSYIKYRRHSGVRSFGLVSKLRLLREWECEIESRGRTVFFLNFFLLKTNWDDFEKPIYDLVVGWQGALFVRACLPGGWRRGYRRPRPHSHPTCYAPVARWRGGLDAPTRLIRGGLVRSHDHFSWELKPISVWSFSVCGCAWFLKQKDRTAKYWRTVPNDPSYPDSWYLPRKPDQRRGHVAEQQSRCDVLMMAWLMETIHGAGHGVVPAYMGAGRSSPRIYA